jgi:hypothetical protein
MAEGAGIQDAGKNLHFGDYARTLRHTCEITSKVQTGLGDFTSGRKYTADEPSKNTTPPLPRRMWLRKEKCLCPCQKK